MRNILFSLLLIFSSTGIHSQNIEYPWLIGIKSNYADFNAVEMKFPDQLYDANWMGKTLPTKLKVARSLNPSFVFAAEFSTITLEADKLSTVPVRNEVTTDNFWRIGGQLEYRLANGYLLSENSRFDPYLFLGLNGSTINEKTYLAQSTGVGFNVWMNDWLGLNAQGSYDYLFDWNDYFHYSLGVVFRFGKKPAPPVEEPVVVEEVVIETVIVEAPEPVEEPEPVVEEPVETPVEEPVVEELVEEIVATIEFRAQNVLFEVASSTIMRSSYPELNDIADIMLRFPDSRFTIYGYTDNTGSASFNLQLSKDRARSVANYLIGKGVDPSRLIVDGFGIENPVATNDTAEGRAKNRRVEIKLIR
jgi:outer membrane protein OmpA-like peptidoglycan-associated protein